MCVRYLNYQMTFQFCFLIHRNIDKYIFLILSFLLFLRDIQDRSLSSIYLLTIFSLFSSISHQFNLASLGTLSHLHQIHLLCQHCCMLCSTASLVNEFKSQKLCKVNLQSLSYPRLLSYMNIWDMTI